MSTTVTIPQWDTSDRLVKARHVAGLSQLELAQALGYSERTIRSYEAGTTTPRRAVVSAWAETTSVPLWWLEGGMPPTGEVAETDGFTRSAILRIAA